MKRLTTYIICLLVFTLTSCDKTVLEFPEGEGADPTLVNLTLNFEVDPQIVPYSSGGRSEASETDWDDVRWIVEVFRDEISGEPVEKRILSSEQAADGHHKIQTNLSLHAARYHIVTWADYVNNGSTADKYYIVNSLASIKIPENGKYIGNEDYKATYVAKQEVDLRNYADQWNETVNTTVTLRLPMAKIEFITTDIDKFLDEQAGRREKMGNNTDNALQKVDLSKIQIQVEYAGFFPSGFNVYTNKPNDARMGVYFECFMKPLTNKEAHLASDYIFVNGSESAVKVNLIIRDVDGTLLNKVENINVPIVRGKLTTIRDEFLTRNYAPGIGISPDFDGEINVVIPD